MVRIEICLSNNSKGIVPFYNNNMQHYTVCLVFTHFIPMDVSYSVYSYQMWIGLLQTPNTQSVIYTCDFFNNSSPACIECGNWVRPCQQALQCHHCSLWQYHTCEFGMDQRTYRLATIKGWVDWQCVACSITT